MSNFLRISILEQIKFKVLIYHPRRYLLLRDYWILQLSFFTTAQKPQLHYQGFTITLRHTTLGRTPLDE
jgi:hypothetical protein